MNPLNHTFNVSGILPFMGNPQDAATIVAEVSAAAAAQAPRSSSACGSPRLPSSGWIFS